MAKNTIGRTWAGLSAVTALGLLTGCQQTNGTTGAPISMLQPGQAAVQNPTLPSLGPFGASARVPPPATGSYGQVSGSPAGASNYAPTGNYNSTSGNVIPMSHNSSDTVGSGIAQAGGAMPGTMSPMAQNANQQWVETNAVQPQSMMPAAADSSGGVRSGGMQVIDLTGAPPPPGYVPQATNGYSNSAPYPSANTMGTNSVAAQVNVGTSSLPGQLPVSQLVPSTSPAVQALQWNTASAPVQAPQDSFQGNVGMQNNGMNAASSGQAAANQPSFSTADRPVQWRAPSR
ncbi:hypothetical protein [Rhodopirellula islandica]|nr:hypothetical protein [Rhodopirellula islandica]